MGGCSSIKSAEYEKNLRVVNSIAAPGRNIDSVRSEIKSRGYDVSDVYYSNKFKESKFFEVRYGSSPGLIDTALYSAGLPDSGQPTMILVEADSKGVVTGVR